MWFVIMTRKGLHRKLEDYGDKRLIQGFYAGKAIGEQARSNSLFLSRHDIPESFRKAFREIE